MSEIESNKKRKIRVEIQLMYSCLVYFSLGGLNA